MMKTNDTYIEQLLEVHKGTIVNIEEYKGAHIKIDHLCNTCDNIWSAAPAKVGNQGTGCPKCALIRSRNKQIKTNEQFLVDLKVRSPNLTPLESYKGAHMHIRFKCTICTHEWLNTPHGVKGCPSKACVNKNRVGYYSVNNIPDTVHVYLLDIICKQERFYKVGLTKNLTKRIYSIKEDLPGAIITIIKCTEHVGLKAISIEHSLLKHFIRYTPDNNFGGHTECLSYSNDITKLIEKYEQPDFILE